MELEKVTAHVEWICRAGSTMEMEGERPMVLAMEDADIAAAVGSLTPCLVSRENPKTHQ